MLGMPTWAASTADVGRQPGSEFTFFYVQAVEHDVTSRIHLSHRIAGERPIRPFRDERYLVGVRQFLRELLRGMMDVRNLGRFRPACDWSICAAPRLAKQLRYGRDVLLGYGSNSHRVNSSSLGLLSLTPALPPFSANNWMPPSRQQM